MAPKPRKIKSDRMSEGQARADEACPREHPSSALRSPRTFSTLAALIPYSPWHSSPARRSLTV